MPSRDSCPRPPAAKLRRPMETEARRLPALAPSSPPKGGLRLERDGAGLDVRQDAVERPRDPLEVECLHQEHGVLLLAVPHEAVQLFLERPGAMRGLLLVGPERAQLALLRERALHSIRPHRPCQLVLEVSRAGVQRDALELAAVVAPQRAQEVPLLADVIEPRESDVAVLPEESWQVPVAAHRHDGDALSLEVTATATPQRLDGAAVTRALNEHYPAQLHNSHQIRST